MPEYKQSPVQSEATLQDALSNVLERVYESSGDDVVIFTDVGECGTS